MNSEKICEGKIILVVPRNSHNTELNERDLFAKYRIISDNHPEYWFKLKKDIKNCFKESQFISINDVHTSMKLIEMNQGISYLPLYVTQKSNSNIIIKPPSLVSPPLSFTYIYFNNNNKHITDFIEQFKYYISIEQQ